MQVINKLMLYGRSVAHVAVALSVHVVNHDAVKSAFFLATFVDQLLHITVSTVHVVFCQHTIKNNKNALLNKSKAFFCANASLLNDLEYWELGKVHRRL